MKDFKVLHLPLSEDRVENIINTLGKDLLEDENGDYVIMLIEVILDYFSEFPYSCSVELNRAECRLSEAKFWLEKFYDKFDEIEESGEQSTE